MGISKTGTADGKLRYRKRWYKVIDAPLSDEIIEKLNTYRGDKEWNDPAAPWRTMPLLWELEEGRLYLVKLYTDGLLEELTGSEKLFASWVDALDLLVEEKTVCKMHEQEENYVEERILLRLLFDKGVFLHEEKRTELFPSAERKELIARYPLYTTVRMVSSDLLIYMEDEIGSERDQLLPLMSELIEDMIDEDDDISLDEAELKEVLERGETCLFASVEGRDIDTIVGSLIHSVTDEKLLTAKGCLLHLRMHKKFPRKSVAKIIEAVDEGLEFNFEPLEPELKEPFYVGSRFVHGLAEDEIAIRILVSL